MEKETSSPYISLRKGPAHRRGPKPAATLSAKIAALDVSSSSSSSKTGASSSSRTAPARAKSPTNEANKRVTRSSAAKSSASSSSSSSSSIAPKSSASSSSSTSSSIAPKSSASSSSSTSSSIASKSSRNKKLKAANSSSSSSSSQPTNSSALSNSIRFASTIDPNFTIEDEAFVSSGTENLTSDAASFDDLDLVVVPKSPKSPSADELAAYEESDELDVDEEIDELGYYDPDDPASYPPPASEPESFPPEDSHRPLELVKINRANAELDTFLAYVETNYIGRLREDGRTRLNPRFPSHMWSVYDRVQEGMSRTNNSVESWNKQFAQDLRGHPSLNSLIQLLLAEQDRTEFLWQNLKKHEHVQARIWQERDKGIKREVAKYSRENIWNFLEEMVAVLI